MVTVFHRQDRTLGGKLTVEKEELKHKNPTHVPKSLAYRGYLPWTNAAGDYDFKTASGAV